MTPTEPAPEAHQSLRILTDQLAGRLDPLDPDGNSRDLKIIKSYIETEVQAKRMRTGKYFPAIARGVLVAIWEKPRLEFHLEEIAGHARHNLGSKRLLIPWSHEAITRYNQDHSGLGLRLEHVTPIDALWRCLVVEYRKSSSEKDWIDFAENYLPVHYRLAVVTKEQAAQIDQVGLKTKGFPKYPFERYRIAQEKIAERRRAGKTDVTFDCKNFSYAGYEESIPSAD